MASLQEATMESILSLTNGTNNISSSIPFYNTAMHRIDYVGMTPDSRRLLGYMNVHKIQIMWISFCI